jgi:hypothetical protein
VHLLSVERGNCILPGLVGFHRDKSKATGAARHPVGHECHLGDASLFFKKILEIIFSRLESEITYIEFHTVIQIGETVRYSAVPEARVSNHHQKNPADDLPCKYKQANQLPINIVPIAHNTTALTRFNAIKPPSSSE